MSADHPTDGSGGPGKPGAPEPFSPPEVALPQPGHRTVHVVVSGTVQGVGFRNWTERLAGQHGLTGWVRNRHNGTVEIMLSGSAPAVAGALERLKRGPRSATVDHLAVSDAADPGPLGDFEVRPTA